MKKLLLPNIIFAFALLTLTTSLLAQQAGVRPSAAAGAGRGATTSRSTTSASSSYGSTSRQYRSNTMLGDALIQIDPETRSLVVVADEDTHKEILKVINNLDRPKPQVLIKVVFVEVNLDKGLNLGVEGSYTFKTGNPLLGTTTTGSNGVTTIGPGGSTVSTTTQNIPSSAGSTSVVTTANSQVLPIVGGLIPQTGSLQSIFGLAAQSQGSFVRVLTDDWQATLYALASRGNLNILSRPSIMARNNQEAVIVVGQEVPFVTNSTITEAGQVNNSVQYQDVGVILRVTPFITSDRNVEMIVAPEISNISATTVQLSPNVSSPVIDKRSAETVVVTPDATTVVIGGLMSKQETQTIRKIPILGDIPIIGFPFRHVVKNKSKSELLIFLTPHIVDTVGKIKEFTLDEANRAEMSQEAFSPADIRKHLDTMELITDPVTKESSYQEVRRAIPVNAPSAKARRTSVGD